MPLYTLAGITVRMACVARGQATMNCPGVRLSRCTIPFLRRQEGWDVREPQAARMIWRHHEIMRLNIKRFREEFEECRKGQSVSHRKSILRYPESQIGVVHPLTMSLRMCTSSLGVTLQALELKFLQVAPIHIPSANLSCDTITLARNAA